MTETEPKRTPANQNPWYVLMTLYGEQEGDSFDAALHEKNREAWNAWAGFLLPEAIRHDCVERGKFLPERDAWHDRVAEIRTLHRAEMLRRNAAGYFYPGFPEPSRTAVINFSKTDFLNPVYAVEMVFPVEAMFNHTAFGRAANFNAAVFAQKSDFRCATFRRNVDFESTAFCRAADFVSVAFQGEARFVKATFTSSSVFHCATFRSTSDFRSANFCGFAFFPEVEFGIPAEDHLVTFSDCQFLKPTNFRNAVFHSRYPDLSGAVLHDKTEFTAKSENWPLSTTPPAEEAKASCARIRHAIAKQGLPEEEHFFYRREMGFACQIGPVWQRLPYQLFRILSDFGYSIQRPVEALLLLWVWPAVFFFGHAQTGRLADYPEIGRALALSFANIFNFLGFHGTFFAPDVVQRLPAALQVLSGFQTLAGVALLFFLGLGLRTRFRLR